MKLIYFALTLVSTSESKVSTVILGGGGVINYTDYQDPRLNIVCYHVMLDAIKFMMTTFQDKNGGALPEKVIWYRGGASTGSYQHILKNEMKGNVH